LFLQNIVLGVYVLILKSYFSHSWMLRDDGESHRKRETINKILDLSWERSFLLSTSLSKREEFNEGKFTS
jgi:hypothetical protein